MQEGHNVVVVVQKEVHGYLIDHLKEADKMIRMDDSYAVEEVELAEAHEEDMRFGT